MKLSIEKNLTMSIKNYCSEIFNLLTSAGESSWSKEFKTVITEFEVALKKKIC